MADREQKYVGRFWLIALGLAVVGLVLFTLIFGLFIRR